MKRHISQNEIYLTGSMRHITRTIYEDNGLYYIKWYGEYIRVENAYGYNNISAGWRTVEQY